MIRLGKNVKSFFLQTTLLTVSIVTALASASPYGRTIILKNNWRIQSSAKAKETGDAISITRFNPQGWYNSSVPSTVLGTLVSDGVFKNPFRGRNLDRIPDSLFVKPWWYRTTFMLPAKKSGAKHVTLRFLGINYKADVWLNGKLVASSDSVHGGFRQFEFDITDYIQFGGMNALAVEIFEPGPGALTLGFVDWNPEPPDRDMGLWRPVEVHISGDVSIEYPFVASKVDTATLKEADLTVSAELTNRSDWGVAGTLRGRIGRISFSQRVSFLPREKKIIAFTPEVFRQLILKNPRLWWTHDFGKPNLYSLRLEFKSDGHVSDSCDIKFGIRQINDYINSKGLRGYELNGKKILIRGGGWVDHIFLDQNRRNLEAQIDYAADMHLNAIRMEGFWGENSDIYNLCDEKGILVMAGWSCQWEWEEYFGRKTDEFGGIKSPADMETAAESFKDEIKWLRNHPSIFLWLYGSDLLPRPELEKKYQEILSKYDTTRPFLASAKEHTSTLTGPTAVKMRGPYDYVPPVYWYSDTAYGGAFGFNTETGPGPQVPRIESLKKMLSPDSLWPINGEWYFHCPLRTFRTFKMYNEAINRRLGIPTSLPDYERKAQFINYEAMRGMFEAFGAKKFVATGIIQWMYNPAWPKMWWQLYDFYLNPTGAFYGAEKACEPIHVEYNYADSGIVMVNSTLKQTDGLMLRARIFDFDMKKRYSFEKRIEAPANESEEVGTIPQVKSLTTTYFLDLRLYKGTKLLSVNFYTLSTVPDVIQEKKPAWHIAESSYADLKELNKLPNVRLQGKKQIMRKGNKYLVAAELHNPSNHLAFMVYLSVRKGTSGGSVLPIFWDDNYISLLPGETRTVQGHFEASDLRADSPQLEVSGWNIKQGSF